jgi:hypothetical protein
MKLRTANNAEVVIKANNEADFSEAKKVAAKMVELSDGQLVECSECEYEMWIQLTACWGNAQASDFKHFYKEAKKATK